MISVEFAPNEAFDDAIKSITTLVKPWSWKKGETQQKVKKRLKSFFPGSMAFLFLTGRAAIYQLLKLLNLPQDTKVLVQGFTCEAVILPVLANNLKPVYVDIEPYSFSMDLTDLTNKINDQTKVIILQSTFGLIPKNRKKILEIAKKNNIHVIEDLAHGFDRNYFKNDCTPTFKILSFGRSKFFSSLFGGAIISSNNDINTQLLSLEKTLIYPSNLFIFKALLYKPLSILIKTTYDLYLGKILHKIVNLLNLIIPEITKKEKMGEFDQLLNKTYPNALSKLLINQLNKLDKNEAKRKQATEVYTNALNESGFHSRFEINNYALLRFPILVKNRKQIIDRLKKKNIYLGKWYDQVIAPKSIDLVKFCYTKGECPNAEDICEQIINLPTNIKLKEAKKVSQKVIEALNDV